MKHIRIFIAAILLLTLALPALPLPAAASGDPERPVIIIDPGHGGVDGGTSVGIRTEKVYNLIIAKHLRDLLLEHGGFEVYLTREDDVYLKYLDRALPIVEYRADLLLSLHCNSSTVDYAKGAMAITSVIDRYSAFTLGESILARIAEATGMRNRGVQTQLDTGDKYGVYYWNSEKNWDMPGASYLGKVSDYYSMNTWSSKFGVPSLIIEHGYLSNPDDRAVIDNEENLLKLAKAEAEALIEYYYGHTHTYTAEKVVDFPSSCSMNGTKSYRCTVCGIKKDTETLPAAPDAHFYRQVGSMRATCAEEGFIEYTCQISFNLNDKGYTTPVHTYTEILPKTEHSYQITSQTAPTCTEAGGVHYTCAHCGGTYSEEVAPTGHTWGADGRCAACGADETPAVVPPETSAPETEVSCIHRFEEISRTEPTCDTAGSTQSACAHCGEETTEQTAALGHDYIVSLDSPATCTEDGYYRARCLRCGAETSETRPATEHSFTEDGVCAYCGEAGDGPRRSIATLLTHPLFIAVLAILLLQAAFLVGLSHHRRRMHKSRRRANTYTMEENDTDETL